MTKDLERTLQELGPGFRPVIDRLAFAADATPMETAFSRRVRPFRIGRVSYLTAASLLVVSVLSILVRQTAPSVSECRPACPREFLLAASRDAASVAELIRTQNPDGSWKTDFLTRQNAAALRDFDSPDAQVAYKKALRNLRLRQAL